MVSLCSGIHVVRVKAVSLVLLLILRVLMRYLWLLLLLIIGSVVHDVVGFGGVAVGC